MSEGEGAEDTEREQENRDIRRGVTGQDCRGYWTGLQDYGEGFYDCFGESGHPKREKSWGPEEGRGDSRYWRGCQGGRQVLEGLRVRVRVRVREIYTCTVIPDPNW